MPKKLPPEHTRFKKGASGNPSGRPKNRLTVVKLRDLLDRLLFMDRTKLQGVVTDPTATVIELMLASVMVQAIKAGDYSRLSALLDRAIGRSGTETIADEVVSGPITVEERAALKQLAARS